MTPRLSSYWLSLVTDVDVTPYYSDPLKVTQQEWANEPSTVFWLDNLYPPDLTNEIKAQSQLAWTGQISAAAFLALALGSIRDLAHQWSDAPEPHHPAVTAPR